MTDTKSDGMSIKPSPPHEGEISAAASMYAPTLFFEGVPFYGTQDGIGTLALSATRLVDLVDGEVKFDRALVAHLKGSLPAYRLLGRTIEAIVKLLEAEERQKAETARAHEAARSRELADERAMAILRDAAEPERPN